MLKDYLKLQGISIYSLAKKSNIPYSTLNDLVNSKVDINNCKLGMVRSIAMALDLSIEELCNIAFVDYKAYSNEYKTNINLSVNNKNYYADFEFKGQKNKIR